jgi:hypothetical protein
MKTKALALSLALCFAGAVASFAQSPQMGMWKLNEAKSHIPAGAVKNSTVVYTADGDNVKVTTDGTLADGTANHTDWTGKFDGKPYPLTGDPNADERSYTKVNDHTLTLANRKAGKVITSARIEVSSDGKTRTVSMHSHDPAGKEISSKAVYDKQ